LLFLCHKDKKKKGDRNKETGNDRKEKEKLLNTFTAYWQNFYTLLAKLLHPIGRALTPYWQNFYRLLSKLCRRVVTSKDI